MKIQRGVKCKRQNHSMKIPSLEKLQAVQKVDQVSSIKAQMGRVTMEMRLIILINPNNI